MARFSAILVFGACLAASQVAQAQLQVKWMNANQHNGMNNNAAAAAFWGAVGNAIQNEINKNKGGKPGWGHG
ncbi:MAG TPA: hypothetical protein VFV87_08875, partial [Pirellulaceae bacterium]|nr:hypothetical protein [Pirellulaceae bacterium]